MPVTTENRGAAPEHSPPEAEARRALRDTLASETFSRSPQQSMLLSYLCDHSLDSAAAELKEYTIAIEAMGLAENYDQAEGSNVRVAIHRLRKRLKTYYEGEGRASDIEIRLLPGEYTPEFLYRSVVDQVSDDKAEAGASHSVHALSPADAVPSPPNELQASEEERQSVGDPPLRPGSQWQTLPSEISGAKAGRKPAQITVLFAVGIAAIVAVVLLYVSFIRTTRPRQRVAERLLSSAPVTPSNPPAAGHSTPVRILVGSNVVEYTDPEGNLWLGDRYYSGGESYELLSHDGLKPPTVQRESDQNLVRHYRMGGLFSYEIPVEPGRYELHLGFVETEFGPEQPRGGGENNRTFAVKINGEIVVDHLDAYVEAGGTNVLDERRFAGIVPSADGKVHLQFISNSGNPAILSFIQLVPQISERANPLRIGTRPEAFVDNLGQVWSADNYYMGGQRVMLNTNPAGTSVPELYQSQRYGSFSYSLPVVPGRSYKLTLHFEESYFGTTDESNANQGKGARLFDILCNGTSRAHDFDILAEAGGPHRAMTRTFSGLQASPQGKLLITFLPSKNYALVNAVEVTEEGS